MKVCKYCGSENADSKSVCGSCGAKEFNFKCENCGNVFDSEFCPSCGVRAGQKAKKCPQCSKEYFSNACPDCGYVPTNSQPSVNTFENRFVPPKKRRTWLWVLGWIFIFPVPLTILLTRRDNNLSTAAKVILIVLAWIAFFVLAYIGQSDDETTEQAQSEIVTVTQQQETETTAQIEYE